MLHMLPETVTQKNRGGHMLLQETLLFYHQNTTNTTLEASYF